MKKALFLLAFIVGSNSLSHAQPPIPSRANIGLNLAALYSGLPELQTSFFLSRYIGISAGAGYMNKPRSGGIKVFSDNVLTESIGSYFKIGVKGRYVSNSLRPHIPVPWLQVQYVYSEYNEHGYQLPHYPDTLKIYKHYQGSVNGLAITAGSDFPIWRNLDFNVAAQFGIYKRKEHFDIIGNVFQPGLGPEWGLIQMGFTFRIGKIKEKAATK